jgi:hypothetical protein
LQVSLPPFAVAPATFRFPALATLASRSALGAGREAILSVLLTARLVDGAASGSLPRPAREQRAAAAAQWLGTACPDARIRAACLAVVDATADDAHEPLARGLSKLIEATAAHLDGASKAELAALVRDVTGPA